MLLKIPNNWKFKVVRSGKRNNDKSDWTLYCAGRAMDLESYLPLPFQSGTELTSDFPSPEEEMNRNLAFNTLTEEARYVINLVLNTPMDAADALFGPLNERITKARTSRYLKKSLGWSRHRVRKVFREISEYTRGFAE